MNLQCGTIVKDMKLIFAQGNPGRQYAHTRHNAGFITLDALTVALGGSWRVQDKFRAEIADVSIKGEKVLLIKPLSFYNETGQVARALVDFYKLEPAEDLLVVHEDLALPFGTIRLREKGSDAGNNGIKSLNANVGLSYTRIRIGIWNELRDQMDDAAFVLGKFSGKEITAVEDMVKNTVTPLILQFIEGSLVASSHKTQ